MNYRSVADMNDAIILNAHRIPGNIDLVVGVPQSGLLSANLYSLSANIPLTDLDSLLAGRIYTSGHTKNPSRLKNDLSGFRRILVLDDSIGSGTSMRDARERIATSGLQAEFIFAAVYGPEATHPEADIVLEQVANPCAFQWNFMQHAMLENACVDIDGVLCIDPTDQENDDGAAYERFLSEARPLHIASRRIGWLVTSRLEKYRDLTEAWLRARGIEYGELVMLDLPSKAERQRLGAHGSFKAGFYRDCDATLFIESEDRQAQTIAQLSGKPVLCVETNQVHLPDPLSPAAVRRRMGNLPGPMKDRTVSSGSRMKDLARHWLGKDRQEIRTKALSSSSRH